MYLKNMLHRIYYGFKKHGVRNGFAICLFKLKNKINCILKYDNGVFQEIKHDPLVSIIAVNYNGSNDLETYFNALEKQSYKNFELVIVDNNSKDNSLARIEYLRKNVTFPVVVVESECNLGFAEGNNHAYKYTSGELIGLLNVDTNPDEDWLKELVNAIGIDRNCAAVTSKTLFFKRFFELKITSSSEFSIDLDKLEESLVYKKYFVKNGLKNNAKLFSVDNFVKILLPIMESYNISFAESDGLKKCIYLKERLIDETFADIKIDWSNFKVYDIFDIINNAGSSIRNNDEPYDVGFGEIDIGQYDSKRYVSAFCGCSVLFRRLAFAEREIFVPEFFAYYEDSELSRYFREKKYKILYAPRSVVRHKHSATSNEGSRLWTYMVTRSYQIYKWKRVKPNILAAKLAELRNSANGWMDESLLRIFENYDQKLLDRINKSGEIYVPRKTFGLYNTYWNSFGGGELHALSLIKHFGTFDEVLLLSEKDVDLDALSKYFNIEFNNIKKMIGNNINTNTTKLFDTFVNSTYLSSLISKAKNSYYIVSFPQRTSKRAFRKSYTFLYNSKFTEKWGLKYFGKVKSQVVYPVQNIRLDEFIEKNINKNSLVSFVSIGRFFKGGHCKNQHKIVSAFKNSKAQNLSKLTLMGSVDKTNPESFDYFQGVESIASTIDSIKILQSPARNVLQTQLDEAHFFVSASGLDANLEENPEQHEHFGMAVLEGCLSGCIPIIYGYGGPADLVDELEVGFKFYNAQELENVFNHVVSIPFHQLLIMSNLVKKNAIEFVLKNQKKYL